MMANDPARPTLMTRMIAAYKGEVRADELEAYRRAGGLVYTELEHAEELRLRLAQEGVNLWHGPQAASGQLLCTWNAFVLQTIGEQLLDADYTADPRTAGYVPPVTSQQVAACFDQVEGWVSRARQAAGNTRYLVETELQLPADLPEWAEADPCPLPHLHGMLAAARAIRQHAEVAFGVFEQSIADTHDHQPDLQRLRQLVAEAATAADYAEGLLKGNPQPSLHEAIEQRLQRSLELYYHVGQLIAMPTHIATYQGTAARSATTYESLNVNARDFDAWCLTDPQRRDFWKADPKARQAIKEMWEYDPDPAATLRIQAQIDAAFRDGLIVYAVNAAGKSLGSYYCCPFPAIYEVRRPVVIGGKRLRPMQQFTYEASAEEMESGGAFKRELIVANFKPTNQIDYCDPDGLHGD
ncbi:hypothetical protein ACFFV7_46280 [Nonomuraea spiralis]|uniref:Uncharacterized protein n=1 Tax=Nonomuraea spiralis TaxID=46182 RepID=A0ABV5IVR7_9ACTN|nr:hypothetical protein [Nonomuraea spiralis]GGS84108.1 hypothetical protein GCM10010176_029710 [Nonomuraea spiralis]